MSAENETLNHQLDSLKDPRSREHDENDEIRRIKAENTVLRKKLQEFEMSRKATHDNRDEASSADDLDNTDNSQKTNTSSEEENLAFQELKVKFETEETENRLLRDQLKEERARMQKEVNTLKSDQERSTEKAKKKQESYLQLQEEKENLHKENRQLEEKLRISNEDKAKMDENIMELEGDVKAWRQQEEELKQELVELKEKLEFCSPVKVVELEQAMNGKEEELASLKLQFEEISSSNQNLMSEIQKISQENTHLEEACKQNEELALKRKNLLDKLSVERQHELTSHQDEVATYKSDIEEGRKKLESCMADLEKSKREITLSHDRHSELLQNYNSVEKKAGWLERTLKELETQIETERTEHVASLEQKDKDTEEKIQQIISDHEQELQKLEDERGAIELEKQEHLCVIEKLNQAAKDKEIEFRVSNKKGEQLLKDLKRQLKVERRRADQLQQKLQDFLTETKCKQTFDELFNKSEISMYKGHARHDSGSHLSTVSSSSGLDLSIDHENTKSSTPYSGTPLSSNTNDSFRLNDETIELISKVADLQLEKNILEEKVRHLEENGSIMVDDLMQKSRIIQSYITDRKIDVPSENVRRRTMTLKEKMKDSLHIGKQGKSEDMLKEMNAKMQRLLEETLEKNIQLEKDVDHLTRELEKYSKSN
eukprot:gene6017-6716_t